MNWSRPSYLLPIFLAVAATAQAGLVADVRAVLKQNDFEKGESLTDAYRQERGVTPELILAISWLGRGALAAKEYDRADAYALATRELALAELKKRPLDAEKDLPLALGASIEVQAHVMEAGGRLSEAVAFLKQELTTYHETSIRTRIQKNINLLSLEGKPALPVDVSNWVFRKPPSLEALRGKPVLLFLWAHWCSDCKAQGPILEQIDARFAPRGLVILGPTQHYGYAAAGKDATPAEEEQHIDRIREQSYAPLLKLGVPVSDETFKQYGVSTTPTLVLIDPQGIVRMYHPGRMTFEELAARIDELLGS